MCTVLRDGRDVASFVPGVGGEAQIVASMLGEAATLVREETRARAATSVMGEQPVFEAEHVGAGRQLDDVSIAVRPGEVLGLVALEGQGQETLFDILAGDRRADRGQLRIDGVTVKPHHPFDVIRKGVVLVPADRFHALLPQRSIRENIAAPLFNRVAKWGPINRRDERRRVDKSVEQLSIDTRAASQVRRLSGGNQQKVTIARWLAQGLRVMLLFDPTRGIDVGTKHQVYDLVRSLADEGAAVVMFTSELREVALVCDRVCRPARWPHRRRAAGGRRRERAAQRCPRHRRRGCGMTTVVPEFDGAITRLPQPSSRWSRLARRHGWTAGVGLLFVVLLLWRVSQLPQFGNFEIRTITAGTMSLAFLAMAQSVIVISGGIDLSIGAMMVLANCLSALWMEDQSLGACFAIAIVVLAVTVGLSTVIGLIITASGVPDIIVTLAASFVLAGLALWVIGRPGGGTSPDFQEIVAGGLSNPWPSILWTLGALLLVWLPVRRSRLGLAIYAVGSNRKAAFLSGVGIAKTRVLAYSIGGLLAGFAGLVITASTGGGEPRATIGANATLNSVAAAVLGGVALTGGIGGLVGPVLAALCLTLIPAIMLGAGWDPSNAETARGVIIILVVLVAGLLQSRKRPI